MMMKHGVFINQKPANCSIYESGLMIKDILRGTRNEFSDEFTIDYFESDSNLTGFNWYPYSFYIINWHNHTLPIKRDLLSKLNGKKIAIVVEVSPDNCIPFTPDWFDAYAVIDPTKIRSGKFFPFARPILPAIQKPKLDKDKFVLGSFGIYSHSFSDEKRFMDIVTAANSSGRDCIVRINLPTATFAYTSITDLVNYGKSLEKAAGKNVEVVVTHDYMNRCDLISWLSEHDINCFPYYRNRPGLSAVTDQAISAGRGIMTTDCDTFRHLHKYISYYPKESYISLATSTLQGVKQMQIDWSPENFRLQFTNLLREIKVI
jgi:glycosyltransferase involved in cell wall biosynthesis